MVDIVLVGIAAALIQSRLESKALVDPRVKALDVSVSSDQKRHICIRVVCVVGEKQLVLTMQIYFEGHNRKIESHKECFDHRTTATNSMRVR